MGLTTARRRGLRAGTAVLAAVCAIACTIACAGAQAQMPIGSVSTLDATVTGASSVANDRAQLGTNGTVVAKDHPAFVQLMRGGSVKVCATSGVHLTAGTPAAGAAAAGAGSSQAPAGIAVADTSSPATTASPASAPGAPAGPPPLAAMIAAWQANIPPPLMVALDRGAMELRMGPVAGDIVMTPDMRLSFNGDGLLDVRIRVTRNGDTCIENRVAGLAGHPELQVGSLFGSETYNVLPGQHVLFEGGNLREVVDNESSPCGCPEEAVKPLPTPEAEISAKKNARVTGAQAAALHPFPTDVSQGLAPPPPVPQAPPQVTHTQVATTLVFTGGASDGPPKKDDAAKAAPPAPEEKKGFFHSIGRFFKRVF